MEKKKWHEWATELVKNTKKCPGDVPSFGLPTDLITMDEFYSGIDINELHDYNDCHLNEYVLGIYETIKDMKEVKVGSKPLEDKVKKRGIDLKEVMLQKKLAKLKENIGLYLDRIHFKNNGSLSVPEPLLNLEAYIENFFS